MSIDRTAFFAALSPGLFTFPPSLGQRAGIETILTVWEAEHPGQDVRWLAYAMGTAHHETGRAMAPVREVGRGRGRPYGQRDPETGQTYYGRGLVQLTWRRNYQAMGARLGLDLLHRPDLAMEAKTSARILLTGMIEGSFSGVGLPRYFNAAREDWVGARRIVNGSDRAQQVTGYGRAYLAALLRSG